MKKNLLLFFALFLISRYSFALVDYTEEVAAPAPTKIKRLAPAATSTASSSSVRKNSAPSGMFELSAKYGVMDAEVGSKSGKINVARFDAHFETSYNIWLDASWSLGSFDSNSQLGSGSSQNGNPQAIIGVNWIEFGGAGERASMDFVAGANFAQKDSDFATSRTDKIVGVETAKRFGPLVFGLGYRLWMTGTANNSAELSIGNIQRLSASLGWMVSPDIRFAVEGASVAVGVGEGDFALAEKISFGTVSPSMQLALSPSISLDMGAVFRSKRLKDEQLLAARLWNLPGSYGSSIFAGLSLAL
tara:strand:- start:3828 stop:4736 length:909 start_codon:yes stop_codon:yes gene_type:complete